MVFYSYYLDYRKTELVYRIEEGFSSSKNEAKLFDKSENRTALENAKLDFYALLFEDENLRIGEYFDTEVKVKEKKSSKEVKVVKSPRIFYEGIARDTIYNEDCNITMGRMPNGYVDTIITSPPYNVGKNVQYGEDMYDEYHDDLEDAEYEKWLFETIDNMLRVTRKHVFFNIQMLSRNKRTIMRMCGKYAEKIKDIIIWNKSIAVPHIQKGIMNGGFEFVFIFSNQNPETKVFEDAKWHQGTFRNVISGTNASQNNHSKKNHATFPLYLPRTILNFFGEKEDLIYDPFTGTGTTQEACVIEGLSYIGSELSADQHAITCKRIEDAKIIIPIKF